MDRAGDIIAGIRASFEAGTLTAEQFQDAWEESDAYLEGEERERFSTLRLFAPAGWVDESEPEEQLVEYP